MVHEINKDKINCNWNVLKIINEIKIIELVKMVVKKCNNNNGNHYSKSVSNDWNYSYNNNYNNNTNKNWKDQFGFNYRWNTTQLEFENIQSKKNNR